MNSKKKHMCIILVVILLRIIQQVWRSTTCSVENEVTQRPARLSAPLLDLNSFESRWNLINKGGVNIKVK